MSEVAIIPSSGEDRWGDPLPGGDPVLVRGVLTWPRRSDETDQDSVITGLDAIFPVGARLPDAIDAVVVGIQTQVVGGQREMVSGTGKRYEVVGEPGLWSYLDGTEAGTEVALQRVRG